MDVVKVLEGRVSNSTDSLVQAILSGAVGNSTASLAGNLNGAFLGLYQGNAAVDHGSTLADLTEATFNGYARSTAITWTAASIDEQGNRVLLGDQKTFTISGNDTPNTIGGGFVVGSDSTTLKYGAQLDAQVQTAAGMVLKITPTYRLDEE